MDNETQFAKASHECRKKAIKSINECFHPKCSEASINSHILQENGILSQLEKDGHVYQMEINLFKKNLFFFRKIGINKAFSFNCFCKTHDNELFKPIEIGGIDFTSYKTRLLFTLRIIYNEKFRKIVNLRECDCLIKNYSKIINVEKLKTQIEQEKLGLADIEKIEQTIWHDLEKQEESFVLQVREIKKKEICLSAFYTYETTKELEDYRIKFGRDKEDTSDIFINIFPYKGKSIFMMGYRKKNEQLVKGYVNSFLKENEKKLERKLTNLLLFQCETWVTSESFYNKRIKPCEEYFSYAAEYSANNLHERQFFEINLFKDDFCKKINQWKKVLV